MSVLRRIIITGVLVCFAVSAGQAETKDLFGAIAYAKGSGRYGYVAGTAARKAAEEQAVRLCNSKGCEIQVWFRNACGALAVGSHGQVTGWGWASSQPDAERNALSECRKRGERCRVIVATCAQPGAQNQSGAGRLR